MISLRRRFPLLASLLLLGASLGVATTAGCLLSFGEYDTHGSGGASSSAASAGAGGTFGTGGSMSSSGGGGATCVDLPPGKILSVAVGSAHACALVEGSPKTVWCWGNNKFLQTGSEPGVAAKAPRLVVGFKPDFAPTVLAAGGDHACAASPNQVYCWGKNDAGQTIPGGLTPPSIPTLAFSSTDSSLSSLALGLEHTCALDKFHGSCWGQKLGVGMECASLPCGVQVVWSDFHHDTLAFITSIAGGGSHTCLRVGVDVHCWGDNGHDQLGVPSAGTPTSADLVTVDVADASDVVAGKSHSCAHESTGWTCWGDNDQGQITGTATTGNSVTPLPAFENFGSAKTFAAGRAHTCAIAMSGDVMCWGAKDQGQHGDGTSQGPPSKSKVPLPMGFTPEGISSRCDQTCAYDGHRVLCWGEPRVDGCMDSAPEISNPPGVHEICWGP